MCHPGPLPTRRPRPQPQAWDFDALGNWDSLTIDGGSPQTRTHNKQNEITAVSGATSPTFDANGNMTTDETGKQYVYDAWNRLKVVKNSGGTTLKTYVYDALNRRVAETAAGATTDLYFSANWQVLEERDSARTNDVKARYVWSPVYVDAMVLRDRDTADDGTLDERLWVQQDANFNVTALVDNNGDVVERYVYDPYGVATVLDETWSVIGSSAYGWLHLHQGGRLDVTSGLYHFRHRDYSPTLGRWVTMDPIYYDSETVNLFEALENNIATRLDPLGLQPRQHSAEELRALRAAYEETYPKDSIWGATNGASEDTGWVRSAYLVWNKGGSARRYNAITLTGSTLRPEGFVYSIIDVDKKNQKYRVTIVYDPYNDNFATDASLAGAGKDASGPDPVGTDHVNDIISGKIKASATSVAGTKYEFTYQENVNTVYSRGGLIARSGKKSTTLKWTFTGEIPYCAKSVGPNATIITFSEGGRAFQEQLVAGWKITDIDWTGDGAKTISAFDAFVRLGEQNTGMNKGTNPK